MPRFFVAFKLTKSQPTTQLWTISSHCFLLLDDIQLPHILENWMHKTTHKNVSSSITTNLKFLPVLLFSRSVHHSLVQCVLACASPLLPCLSCWSTRLDHIFSSYLIFIITGLVFKHPTSSLGWSPELWTSSSTVLLQRLPLGNVEPLGSKIKWVKFVVPQGTTTGVRR